METETPKEIVDRICAEADRLSILALTRILDLIHEDDTIIE